MPMARRNIHSEGLRNTHSLDARMNSNLWKGSVSSILRRSTPPEYERLLITAVRTPSSAQSSRKGFIPAMGSMGSVAHQRMYSSSSSGTSNFSPSESYIVASSLKPSVSSSSGRMRS